MSKEIDFSKAPEGATHYGISEVLGVCWYKNITEKCYEFYYAEDIGKGCRFDKWSANSGRPNHSPIKIQPQWSIYTNDKPLSELSDEQAAALFNAWRMGEKIEYVCRKDANFYTGEINLTWKNFTAISWCTDSIYRIKQKSERELFVDAAMQLMTSETERTLEQQFGALFDSGKFKLKDEK